MQTHKFGGCGWCGNLNFRNTFMFFFCMGQKRRHFWIMFIEWKKKTLLDYVYRVEKEDTFGLCLQSGKRRHFHLSWGKKGRIPTKSFFFNLLTNALKKVILLYYCHTMHNAPWWCFMFCQFFYNQSSFSSISKTKNTM